MNRQPPHRSRTLLAGLLAALLSGCGGGSGGDAPGAGSGPTPSEWDPVARAVDAAFATGTVPGIALAVYAPDGRLLYSRVRGDFALDRNVAVASASKMVSGLAILRAVEQGFLSLDSTTGSVLGWTGPQAAITLRQLLSFTSGLPTVFTAGSGPDCTRNAFVTLAQCVADLGAAGLAWPPGSRFEYGNTHLHVAARMAEVAIGASWATIFAQQLRQPFGWPAAVAYFTAPRQSAGTLNPLIAGGLRISMTEYAQLLGVIHNRGSYQGQRLLSATLVEAMGRDPFPAAVTGFSPYANFGLDREYGLTAWLECTTPATGCNDITSPGAFGFTPWIDRDGGYYALLGMEGDGLGEISAFAVQLSLDLRPLIRTAVPR
jgi:CubicO group peptidase (beta-lactamase class C family)